MSFFDRNSTFVTNHSFHNAIFESSNLEHSLSLWDQSISMVETTPAAISRRNVSSSASSSSSSCGCGAPGSCGPSQGCLRRPWMPRGSCDTSLGGAKASRRRGGQGLRRWMRQPGTGFEGFGDLEKLSDIFGCWNILNCFPEKVAAGCLYVFHVLHPKSTSGWTRKLVQSMNYPILTRPKPIPKSIYQYLLISISLSLCSKSHGFPPPRIG